MFTGRCALITGATRGIGKAIALRLAKDGASLILLGTSPADRAADTLREVTATGVRAAYYQCNVANAAEVDATVKAAIADFGRIDILINNAGITRDKLMIQMTEEDFDAVIDVNLKGTFLVTKVVARHMMKNRYGRIVNITSVVGLSGNPGQANYTASKAGVIALTKTTAKEFASRGITCNAVAPGYIETDMTAVLSDTAKEAMLSQVPVGRAGTPEDVANAVAFLASEASSYITGEVIKVTGGMYA